MRRPVKTPEIKEGANGAFFVKLGNENLGGFQRKENAELFIKAYMGIIDEAKSFQDYIYGFVDTLSREEVYYSRKAYIAGAEYGIKIAKISKASFLTQTSFKNVSGNWQFKGDITPERVYKIMTGHLTKPR